MTSHWSRLYFMTFYIVTMVRPVCVCDMSVEVCTALLPLSVNVTVHVCDIYICALSRW